MAINSAANLLSVDSLFTTQEERDEAQRETVRDIPLAEISDFPNHPFKVRMDESMTEMADSVRQYGVLVPGLVRPKSDGGYEMVAGHRRKKASELAGLETVPCIVRELTDDEATIIMVDSNLQREQILPSEKAFAYKMKLDANPLVHITLDKAILETPGAQPLLHSDRGFQYTSRIFHSKLEQVGITQSMSRVAHCIDNGPMEGFWGILKRERYYGRRFSSKPALVQMIENYIHYYNTRRVQRNLGILTPMEKHVRLLAA